MKTKRLFALFCVAFVLLQLSCVCAESNELYIAGNMMLMDKMEGFEKESGIHITFSYDFNIQDVIANAYVIQNPDIDVFVIRTDSGLYTIKNTNYYESLEGNETLMQAYQSMYPVFQSAMMDEGHLVGVMVNASPMGMMVAEDTLAEWGFSVPETFDELLDTCNAILADDLLTSDMTLMMDSYTQQSVMNLFMKYYIITSIQEGRRVDFQNETFLHYVQRIKDELPETDTLTGERFDIIFMLPSAVDVPSTRIQRFPRIFEDQSSAVETYATIAIVNPYSDNKDAAIDFLAYCTTHMTNSDYFLYQTLTDPIENPTVVSQIESLEKDIALLEAAENRTNEQEDKLADDRAQLEQLESKRYMVTEDAIRYYQSLAESLYISEGSPLSYDDALRVLAERYLNGAFDAETFAQECQSHIEMIYAEIGE